MGIKIVTIGDFEPYVGMRGYNKEKATISITDEKGNKLQDIGICKVEPVLDAEGKLITTVVYPRISYPGLGPKKGQPWQFASRRALTQFLQKQLDDVAPKGFDEVYEKSPNYVDLDAEDAFKSAAHD